MKIRKVILWIVVIVLLIGGIVIGIKYKKEQERQERFRKAEKLFEQQVISEMEKQMQAMYEDLRVEVIYSEHEPFEYIQFARINIYSDKINKYYTTEWEDENCSRLVEDLLKIRGIYISYAGSYCYDIDGQTVDITLYEYSYDMLDVYGGTHEYNLHLIEDYGSTSLSIDGKLMYYDDGKTEQEKAPVKKPNKNINGSSYGNYDPYDVHEYDDPDDFAEEWAEEFGDGDFEEGYDDAYEYWEDEYEE